MGHYKSNLRDIEFALFEVFGRGEVLGTGPYADMDQDTAREVLREVRRLAENELAASFVEADRTPPVFDPATSTVTLPESFRASFKALMDAEWFRLDLPEHLGGTGAPPSLRWAASEMLLGANPAAFMYMSGPGFGAILDRMGTPEQQQIAQLMVDRKWGATMVLTEPDAGSDVGVGRTKAIRQPDGTWHLSGVKRFITSAEHDLCDNIVHLVLARPEGAGPGSKGLSLFVVPKFLVDDLSTGELGDRNGVYVTNVEHKMGLKASTTCELTFGDRHPAIGYLVGDVHDGIAQMFQVIQYARMLVGTKAIATLSTGYLNALAYAKERVQGPDLSRMTDRTAPRVTITHHPDVRRMLLLQKGYAEGMRAMLLWTATLQDQIELARAAGLRDQETEALNDLMLPLVKGIGSERSYELLNLSLQTIGGSGFLQDYPIEQYLRDAKIDSIYEGTTGIQSMDLFFRKIVRDQGAALSLLLTQVSDFAKGEAGNGTLAAERELLRRGLDDVQATLSAMVGYLMSTQQDPRNVYKVGLNTVRLMLGLGDLVIGWLLLREAEVALAALAGSPAERDVAFYQGKVAAARFFVASRLPLLAADRAVAEAATLDPMDLPEAAF
jgi:alkylation response protein AidB-like acyl-CoA dehydrogenase